MLIIPPTQSTTAIRTEAIPDVTKIWKVGQVLNATAERNVKAQDTILLRMGQSVLETKTPIDLKAGDQLKLLVKSLIGDTPVLKILSAAMSNPHQATAQNLKSFIAQQKDLSSLLQLSQKIVDNSTIPKVIKQLLTNLHLQLPTAEQATQAKLLKKMIRDSGIFLESKLNHQQAKALQHGALHQDDLSRDNITRNILQSDIKSQLLNISAQLQRFSPELFTSELTVKPRGTTKVNVEFPINQFIKGEITLNQLSTLLTNTLSISQSQLIQQFLNTADITLLPKELLHSFTQLLNYIQQQSRPQQVLGDLSSMLKNMSLLLEIKISIDGVLAKITSQQLIPLTRESDNLLLLLLDLNLTDKNENHIIQFRLEEEQSTNQHNDSNWTVTLNFNFESIGPVQAKLHLTDNNISTLFRAEKESTAENITKQINLLDTALKDIGFDAINLGVTHDSISQPRELTDRDLADNVRILDEKA